MITKERWVPAGDVGGRKEDQVRWHGKFSELKELDMLTVLLMMVVFQIHVPEKIHQIYVLMSVTC